MQGSINFDGSLVGNITGGGGGGGSEVVITPVLTSGTKIADVTVDGENKDLFAPTPTPPTPATEVSVTQTLASGTKIGSIEVDGENTDLFAPTPTPPTPATEVSVTQTLASGTKIGSIEVDGESTDLYAPYQSAVNTSYDNTISGFTADNVQEAIDEISGITGDGQLDIGDDLTDAVNKIKSSLSDLIPLEKTASGAIVTFDDGINLPLPKLEVTIEPQQDLHGYDSPWVGGAGKNKLEVTVTSVTTKGVTFTVNDDGTIKANGTASGGNATIVVKTNPNLIKGTSYILNGCPQGGGSSTYRLSYSNNVDSSYPDNGSGVTFTEWEGDYSARQVYLSIMDGVTVNNLTFKPMIRLASAADSTFAPYSNICPISGWSKANVTVADDVETPTVSNVYTIDLDGTRYGGELDVVSGVLTITDGYIASYNSEALPSTWISDRDVYAEGTTPTVGAEVVYKLATPLTIKLTPTQVISLLGVNNIYADTGDLELTYFVNNSLVQAIYDMLNILNS